MKGRHKIERSKNMQEKLITPGHDAHKGLIARVFGDSVRSFTACAEKVGCAIFRIFFLNN
jgi:hypothetical protein